ncbi:MAG: MFS transporter [Candidatus Ranarchaeia archaeon]
MEADQIQKPTKDPLLYIALGITVISMMGQSLLSPAIAERLLYVGISSLQLNTYQGFLSGLTALPPIILVPIYGFLIDKFGKKKIMIPLILGYGLTAPLIYFVSTFDQLLVLTVAQEILSSGFFSFVLIIYGDRYKSHQLSSAVGINSAVFGTSRVIFPIIGGIITEIDFRISYLFGGLGVPVAILMFYGLEKYGKVFSKESKKEKGERGSFFRLFMEKPGLIGAIFLSLAIPIIMTGIVGNFYQIYLRETLGIPAVLRGALVSLLWISSTLVSANCGRISKYASIPRIVTFGFLIYGTAGLWIIFSTTFETIALGFVIYGTAHGLVGPQLSVLQAKLPPLGQKGKVITFNRSIVGISRSTIPLVGGPLIDQIGYQIFALFTVGYAAANAFGAGISPKINKAIKKETPELPE